MGGWRLEVKPTAEDTLKSSLDSPWLTAVLTGHGGGEGRVQANGAPSMSSEGKLTGLRGVQLGCHNFYE